MYFYLHIPHTLARALALARRASLRSSLRPSPARMPSPDPRGRADERSKRSKRDASTSSSSSRSRSRSRDAADGDQTHRFKQFLKKRHERLESVRRAAERAEREALDAGEALIGPPPPPESFEVDRDAINHGKHLLAGEGEAMGRFAAAGERIPRRGEIGLKTDQIERFENLGYVMSGSRHSRMNAVRMRKEAQVYSAEEKAALAALSKEERAAKERRVLDDMRALVQAQLESRERHD